MLKWGLLFRELPDVAQYLTTEELGCFLDGSQDFNGADFSPICIWGAAKGFQKSSKKARYEQLQAENMTAFSASQLPALLGKNLEGTRSIQRCEEIKIVLCVMTCGYATTYPSSLV